VDRSNLSSPRFSCPTQFQNKNRRAHQQPDSLTGIDLPDLRRGCRGFLGVLQRRQEHQIIEMPSPKTSRVRNAAGGVNLNFVVPQDGRPQRLFGGVLIDEQDPMVVVQAIHISTFRKQTSGLAPKKNRRT
jgi:hypothetical protein